MVTLPPHCGESVARLWLECDFVFVMVELYRIRVAILAEEVSNPLLLVLVEFLLSVGISVVVRPAMNVLFYLFYNLRVMNLEHLVVDMR